VVDSNSDIKTLDDLKGKTVEVQEGSSVIEGLNNNTTLKNSLKDIVEVRDITIVFMDLKSGVCDAILVDREIANYNIIIYCLINSVFNNICCGKSVFTACTGFIWY
jgi:polar amino acid transport system substrate-binding protein